MKRLIFSLFIIIMFILAGYGVYTKTSTQPNLNPIQITEPTITQDEYNKIQVGMTYEQVVKIVGGNGEFVTENKDPENSYYIAYQYNGVGDPGANANFVFKNGKMLSKAQIGLK